MLFDVRTSWYHAHMAQVLKYTVHSIEDSKLVVPEGSRFLSAGEQDGRIVCWFQVFGSSPGVFFPLRVFGTGWKVPSGVTFLQTVQMSNGLVWHLFQETEDYNGI